MQLITKQCDVCTYKTDDHVEQSLWGIYQDLNAKRWDVCQTCQDRLLEPFVKRLSQVA